jgi:hypothetical protein
MRMNHISEDQLTLFYYGESPEAGAIEEHLSACDACRAELRALQLVLNTVDSIAVPERGADYGQAVWKQIEPRLAVRKRRTIRAWWIWTPVMAALLLAAFMAGSFWQRRAAGPEIAKDQSGKNNQQIRERILLVAVGDHLERSQMVLAELDHAPEGKGKLDISDERQLAEDLLDDNRLYRETARNTGDNSVASVLDDLERVLLEIAHSPSEISNEQLDDLRREIESRGLLFKVRVLGTEARDSGTRAPASENGQTSKKL